MSSDTPNRLTFNGISDVPFRQPEIAEFLEFARGRRSDADEQARARRLLRDETETHLLADGEDPGCLDQAGWAVAFSDETGPEIREALAPLLERRKEQAAAQDERRFRIYEGAGNTSPGVDRSENLLGFLESRGAQEGLARPWEMPYNILLVGDPQQIPFGFQYSLDLRYAVGRLSLPTTEDYAAYAKKVVAAEKAWESRPPNRLRTVFFSPGHDEDDVEVRMAEQLVCRLTKKLLAEPELGWKTEAVLYDDADRDRLIGLYGDSSAPEILFTACHGLFYDGDPAVLRDDQGVLMCRGHYGQADPRAFCVGASDLAPSGSATGQIAIQFGCFSAGVPIWDGWEMRPDGTPRVFATEPYLTALPTRLLADPKSPTLAVLGHVDRAWTYSFVSRKETQRLNDYEDCLRRLQQGLPVGYAAETFDLRYASLSAEWQRLREREQLEPWNPVDPLEMIETFCTWLDARSFVVLGDPAVRLPTPAGTAP